MGGGASLPLSCATDVAREYAQRGRMWEGRTGVCVDILGGFAKVVGAEGMVSEASPLRRGAQYGISKRTEA